MATCGPTCPCSGTGRRSAWLAHGANAGPEAYIRQIRDGNMSWTRRTVLLGTQAVTLNMTHSQHAVLIGAEQGSATGSLTISLPPLGRCGAPSECRGLKSAYWPRDSQSVLAAPGDNQPIKIYSDDAATQIQRCNALTPGPILQQIVLTSEKNGGFANASGVWKTVHGGKL